MIEAIRKNGNTWASISFEQNMLNLALIQKSNKPYLFELTASSTTSLTHHEYHDGMLYNPTAIAQHIIKFLTAHATKQCPIALSMNGPHIVQSIKSYTSAQELEHNITKKHSSLYDYTILGALDNGNTLAYTCMIDRQIIFQYQLLALMHGLNVQSISTHAMAHITVYRYLSRDSINTYDLIHDLVNNNYHTTTQLVHDHTIAQVVRTKTKISTPTDYQHIRIALGAIIPLL